ncbi:hypothetical protein ADK17_09920, partial [Bacillus anthracis]
MKEEALDNFIKAYTYKNSVEKRWVRTCLFFIVECLVKLKRYEEALEIVRDTEELWPLAPDSLHFGKGKFIFYKNDIVMKKKFI